MKSKIETDYNWGSWNLLAWKKGRRFMMLPLVSPQKKDVWETSLEMTYWWLVTTLIWVVLLIGWSNFFKSVIHRSICFWLSSMIALFRVSRVPSCSSCFPYSPFPFLFPLFPLVLLFPLFALVPLCSLVPLVPPCSSCFPFFPLFPLVLVCSLILSCSPCSPLFSFVP